MPEIRNGRKKNISGQGIGVHKRGEGLHLGGPVGAGRNGFQGNYGGREPGSGHSGSSGRSPFRIILILILLFLGGGSGLTTYILNDASPASEQTSSGISANTTQSDNSSVSSAPSTSQNPSDLDILSMFFGNSVSTAQAVTGSSHGWTDPTAPNRPLNTSVADGTREKFTKIKDTDSNQVTLMVYMCGADLESRNGMATADLSEMAAAALSDHVNVLVYTGGAKRWRNQVVSSDYNQIYTFRDGKLLKLLGNDGKHRMTDPGTLTNFINYSATHFPANRYALIFWDHGGGSATGFGYDEKYADGDTMDLLEIRKAIHDSGLKFDFIGFDACLMATAENALALSDSADYLIASEETEPGTGWYYTDWLTALSKDPAMPTIQLGQKIIDDYIRVSRERAPGQKTTLSLIDLAEIQHTLPAHFSSFSKEVSDALSGSQYSTISRARNSSREFAQSSHIDQVDLVDLANHLQMPHSKDVTDAIQNAVKYNRTGSAVSNAYGLSIYFPYARLNRVDHMVNTYQQLGLDNDYTKAIQKFATVTAAGQAVGSHYGSSSSAQSAFSANTGNTDLSSVLLEQILGELLRGHPADVPNLANGQAAFLTESGMTAENLRASLDGQLIDPTHFNFIEKNGKHLLHLSEEEWSKIRRLEMSLFYDDGQGHIDLGRDTGYRFTKEGDLIGDFDGTWISLNDQPVMYIHLDTQYDEEGNWLMESGRIPCMINGVRSDLIIVFDKDHPDGSIAGIRTDYVNGETDTLAKTMTHLQAGDKIDFLCDYYLYNGHFENNFYLGRQMVVSDPDNMKITNTDVGNSVNVAYVFTDLYGNTYWTKALSG